MLVTVLRAVASLALLMPTLAQAAKQDPCPPLLSLNTPLIVPVADETKEVGLTFVGHATFLIETPGGVRIATDYNDYIRPAVVPDIATMNKAHSTHYSNHPDPGIKLILRGWNPAGGPIHHDVTFGDVRIRNVQTNIRGYDGSTDYDGNSIFVFESAGLCIAHLGHLHHELTPEHLVQLGRIDVLLVPVDGNYTMSQEDMLKVVKAINPPLVIPMHIFSETTLNRFLDAARATYPVDYAASNKVMLSRDTLPSTPKILVLPGR